MFNVCEVRKIVNLTPHDVCVNGVIILPSGIVARCKEDVIAIGNIMYRGAEIPVIKKQFSDVYDLPDAEPGTIYIVSLVVAQALSGIRTDVFAVGDTIRDAKGKVVGAKSLAIV